MIKCSWIVILNASSNFCWFYCYLIIKFDIFQHGRQEDAEEFLGSLLNGMHDELVGALGLVRPKQEQGVKGVINSVLLLKW